MQEPSTIKVGEGVFEHQFSGSKRCVKEKWDTFQYVSIVKSLEQLLKDETVVKEIDMCGSRVRSDNLLEDYCDGTVFKQHPLFSSDPYALQIIAYYDEVELCNPLGSHVKRHKVGIVFFSLGNIHPKYRSQLKAINLAVIATVPVIERNGLNCILQPFVDDLNQLSTIGIDISTSGGKRNFKGALLVFLADNLASNDIGGFKKSFSFAYRCCRTCLATVDTIKDQFTSEFYSMRTLNAHLKHLSDITTDVDGHYSKTYGVNRKSCLLNVNYFDMFLSGLPHDAMHDLLEGLVPCEVKYLLTYYISQRTFTLNEFNEALLSFNFGYSESTEKPAPILRTTLYSDGKSLRYSASQMLLLVRVLPLLIGDKISTDDPHWCCFLLLRKTLDIVLSPIVSTNQISSLKLLIKEHHTRYVALYGLDAYIPKMHFLLHYPEQIERLGPMIRAWTIRHEAKLNFFKQASRIANFKNVSLSLANRHQRWMCYMMASNSLLRSSLQCGPAKQGCSGISYVKDEPANIQHQLLNLWPSSSIENTLFKPTWVNKDGTLFQDNNAFLIIGSDGLDPKFGCLTEILVLCNDLLIFVGQIILIIITMLIVYPPLHTNY